jgi:glycine C-acetyltransferase
MYRENKVITVNEKIDSDLYTYSDFAKSDGDVFAREVHDFYLFIHDGMLKKRYYYQRPLLSASKNRVIVHDYYTETEKEMIMMASTNYLGMSTHPKVIEAGIDAGRKYGFGSGSVPLFSGTYDLHRKLEKEIASLFGHEDAVLFASGYAANVGCIAALARKNDVVIHDRMNHASLFDGSIFSRASLRVYRHNSPDNLESVLKKRTGNKKAIIVTDGVFSMDGDIAMLPDVQCLAERYNAVVIVDDAHALGVIGKTGMGTAEHFDMTGKVDIVTGCMSKSLGSIGGFVSSTKEIVNYVRYYSRYNMFSTSLPPPDVAAALAAIEVLKTEPIRLASLRQNISYMMMNLKKRGFDTGNSESAIIPIIVGDEIKLRDMTRELHEQGIFANAVSYPAVPKHLSRIRLSLMSTHTREDIDEVLQALEISAKKVDLGIA